MAKETKAKSELRVAIEADAAARATADSYPARLMDALSRALALGAHASVDAQGMTFDVVLSDFERVTRVPYAYATPQDEMRLKDLLFEVGNLEFEREEARRLDQVRETALAKLSPEEQKVLGLVL
jgi:hypothetical protein